MCIPSPDAPLSFFVCELDALSRPSLLKVHKAFNAASLRLAVLVGPLPWQTCGGSVLNVTSDRYSLFTAP